MQLFFLLLPVQFSKYTFFTRKTTIMPAIDSEPLKALMDSPALSPPRGFMPRFSNSHSIPLIELLVGIIFSSLCTASVAIRLYTRLQVVKKLGWDDCKLSQLLDVVDIFKCVKACPSSPGYVSPFHCFIKARQQCRLFIVSSESSDLM